MNRSHPLGWRAVVVALLLAGALLASGCATVAPPGGPAAAVSRVDPWEGFNRKVFAFNEAVTKCDSNRDGKITETEAKIFAAAH